MRRILRLIHCRAYATTYLLFCDPAAQNRRKGRSAGLSYARGSLERNVAMRAVRNIGGAKWAGARFRATAARRRATRIRALVLAATVCAFASAASAQLAPYLFMAPDATTAGAANSANRNQRCYWQPHGRSAPQEQCEGQSPAEPKK
jgi:hypothetical protein